MAANGGGMKPGDICLVTGVSGYLASWLAKFLLDEGMRVRGTVRSLQDAERLAALEALLPGVDLVAADLRSDAGWAEAVAGCRWVFHVASPQAVASEVDRTGGAVQGTERLLRAAFAEASLEKVVLTSSEAAIAYGHPRSRQVFTEDDWTVLDGPAGRADYFRSKTLAEQAGWRLARDADVNPRGVPLAVINPSFIAGPSLVPWARYSLETLRGLADGSVPIMPDMTNRIVDVRDCALMHIALMNDPEADGQRHFSFGVIAPPQALLKEIRSRYGQLGFGKKTRIGGRLIIGFASLFSRDAAAIASKVGSAAIYQPKRPSAYGYQYTDLGAVLSASIDDMLERGWIKPQSA
jgi:dihydroflavonol-4-reductase